MRCLALCFGIVLIFGCAGEADLGAEGRDGRPKVSASITDIATLLDAIPTTGQPFTFDASGQSWEAASSAPSGNFHVQGIARYASFTLLTHNDPSEGFIALVDSTRDAKKLMIPKPSGEVQGHAHPGGIGVLGDTLVIPLSNSGASPSKSVPAKVVRFFDATGLAGSTPSLSLSAIPDITDGVGDPQAAALEENAGMRTVAVVTGTRTVAFYRQPVAGGSWTRLFEAASNSTDSNEEIKTCTQGDGVGSDDMPWCCPDGLSLMRDSQGLALVTFSRASDPEMERVGLYRVNIASSTLQHVKNFYFERYGGNTTHMRYGGGAFEHNGRMTLLGARKELCSPDCNGLVVEYRKPLSWEASDDYDTGQEVSVALRGDVVVQVHRGSSATTNQLYYRLGHLNADHTVTWSSSRSWELGRKPSIAMKSEEEVVAVFEAPSSSNIMQCVGAVESTEIEWSSCISTDTGKNPVIAADSSGRVIELHNGAHPDKVNFIYFRRGHVSSSSGIVFTGEGARLDGFGLNPAVAMNSIGTVIELHEGATQETRGLLFQRFGSLTTTGVTWGGSSFLDSGTTPSVGIDDAGRLLEVHSNVAGGRLYFSAGRMPSGRPVEWWDEGTQYTTGRAPSITLDDGVAVESHSAMTNETPTPLWSRTATFLPEN